MSYVNSITYDYKSYFIPESLSKLDQMLSFYMHGKTLNDFMSAAILCCIVKIDQLKFEPLLKKTGLRGFRPRQTQTAL